METNRIVSLGNQNGQYANKYDLWNMREWSSGWAEMKVLSYVTCEVLMINKYDTRTNF